MQIELENPGKKPMIEEETDALLELERLARQDSRMEESLRLLVEITDLLWRAKEIERLMVIVKLLTSKRGQPVKAISKMVMKCMSFIPEIQEEGLRMKYVQVMKDVTEKKIYLEVEYARCCMLIVKHKEKDGASKEDILAAAKIMENVQVETYGSMDKFEKLEFILYQMKLNILLEDMTKLIIVSKKVNLKFFKDESFAKLEVTYYLYCLHYYQYKDDYQESSNCLGKVNLALAKLEAQAEEAQSKNLIVEEDNKKTFEYDPILIKLYKKFLDKRNSCEGFISMMLLEDFSVEKIEKVKKESEKHQTYLDDNYGLRKLVQAFLSKELTSCKLEDYRLEDIILFDKYGDYNNRYHLQLEKQLIKKNLHTGKSNSTKPLINSISVLQQYQIQQVMLTTSE